MEKDTDRMSRIAALIRALPPGSLCLLFSIDVTGFQSVNHLYGFAEGDRLLAELEHSLATTPDLLFQEHLYADNFLVLVQIGPQMPAEDMVAMFERAAQAFLARQKRRYPACKLRLACGICRVTADTVAQALNGANFARKESKRRGHPVLYNNAMREEMDVQYEQENSLTLALQEERFCFHLQPQVELATGAIVGAEALARRIGPGGALIPPDQFLPLMEATGSVIELDLLIFRQVCAFLADRLAKQLPVVRTAVNLSRLHTHAPQVADRLHAIALQAQVPPELLEFELTETIFLDEFKGAKQLIDRLRAYGYCVSIDDFGSGYAGINIWQDLTFDVIKLDRRFLSDDPELKRRNEALVPNLINIGHRLGTQVLCEGAETARQCEYLQRLGCSVVQGYYFSKPVPPEDFYERYRQLDGHFPLPFVPAGPAATSLSAPGGARSKRRNPLHRYRHLVILLLCTLLLCGGVAGVTAYYHQATQREFDGMVLETLSAYTGGQQEKTRSKLESTAATLQTFAHLIAKQGQPADFLDTYLLALNEQSTEVKFLYTPASYFEQTAAGGAPRQEDLSLVERLSRGETVISNITYSQRMGGIYCFAVGVPVFVDDTFTGVLRGIIPAETLVSTSEYPPAQGEIIASFLVDDSGQVLRVTADPQPWPNDLFGFLQENNAPAAALDTLRAALMGTDTAPQTVSLGSYEGTPVFLSVADLGYNGWHLGVCLGAGTAARYSEDIVRSVTRGTVILLAVILVVCAILFWYLNAVQHQSTDDERRYLLLEQFSDTVLFDYDFQRDRIRFTPNASKLFRCHELVQEGFVRHLPSSYIFAGDLATIRQTLGDRQRQGMQEFRVRLLHPEEDHYFWCLVQCQYLWREGALRSIVGKIVDIDEQKRQFASAGEASLPH